MTAEACAYKPKKASTTEALDFNGFKLNVRYWGAPNAPPLVMLHGGRDASATFQFVVDALKREWRIIAPDWRGHGESSRAAEGYWFQDFLRDLDRIVDRLLPGRPFPLAGHSLGGNMAMLYAGLRPERVTRLVSLDGFGLPDGDPVNAPAYLRRWLDGWRDFDSSEKAYTALSEMAARLVQANPKLPLDKALFLAAHVSREIGVGRFAWSFDPMHRIPFGTMHRRAEWFEIVRHVTASTLFIGSNTPFPPRLAAEEGGLAARFALVKGSRYERIEGAGHNFHHEQPERVAALIEEHIAG